MWRFDHIATFIALCVPAMVVCAPAAANAVTVRDASGRHVEVKDASRIVSIGGAVTEILFALGVGERVVGIDLTSTFPPAARELHC